MRFSHKYRILTWLTLGMFQASAHLAFLLYCPSRGLMLLSVLNRECYICWIFALMDRNSPRHLWSNMFKSSFVWLSYVMVWVQDGWAVPVWGSDGSWVPLRTGCSVFSPVSTERCGPVPVSVTKDGFGGSGSAFGSCRCSSDCSPSRSALGPSSSSMNTWAQSRQGGYASALSFEDRFKQWKRWKWTC